MGRSPEPPKSRPHWANTWGAGRSISQLLLGPHAPNTFSRFLRHIGTFLDYLGGVDTPMGRVPVPRIPGQVEQIHLGVGRSISQLSLGSHAPNLVCRFLRNIGTFLDYLGGVETPMGRAPAPKFQAKLRKYMGSREVNISASIRALCTKYFL